MHHLDDESFSVLEGKVALVFDGKWLQAGPGAFVYGPRNVAHGFKVIGDRTARMLVCNPSGFERSILDQATPIGEPPPQPNKERLMALAQRYGIEIHGPLPEAPSGIRLSCLGSR